MLKSFLRKDLRKYYAGKKNEEEKENIVQISENRRFFRWPSSFLSLSLSIACAGKKSLNMQNTISYAENYTFGLNFLNDDRMFSKTSESFFNIK